MIEIKNKINNFFSGLSFEEETHTYSFKGKKLKGSVSSKIKAFYESFDSNGKSVEKGLKSGLPLDYYLKRWKTFGDEACAIGDRTHLFGEFYPWYKDTLKPEGGFEIAIVKFWNDLPEHIVPVFTELKMYHKQYLFPGTADIILYNTKTKKFIISDYKTNKDLFKNYVGQENNFEGKKMLKPFENMLDCPFSHYQLQFSFYQILFEQTGFEVERRRLVHLLPTGDYELYDTDDYTYQLLESLKTGKLTS